MSEVLVPLLQANLAAAATVAVVLALRLPARRVFGARIAYGLWVLVPLAGLATLLPARVVTVRLPAMAPASQPAAVTTTATPLVGPPDFDPWPLLLALWIGGAVLSLGWLAWRQAQFGRAVRDGVAGPAVVGVLKPRIVTPSDFDHRYTPRERFVVLAHEAAHIARHDSRINALVAAARCVNWFNPLLHVLARCLRVDQELACDAQVVATHPTARRSYAEAMLKAQLAARPLPLGCYWLADAPHPLAERIRLLSRRTPDPAQHALGVAAMAALALAAVGSTWATKPAQVMFIEAPPAPPARPQIFTPPGRAASAQPVRARLATDAPSRPSDPLPAEPLTDPAIAAAEAQADALAAAALPQSDSVRSAVERPPRLPRERRVYTLANRSSVEPGSAVRVVATAFDPEGRPLMADLTSFGSQHYYRTGTYISSGSRQGVYTSVVQRGDRLWVTVSLNRRFQGPEVGTVEMRSGETRTFALPNGQMVTVTPTVRPETTDEAAGVHAVLREVDADLDRSSRDAWEALRQRCRGQVCATI